MQLRGFFAITDWKVQAARWWSPDLHVHGLFPVNHHSHAIHSAGFPPGAHSQTPESRVGQAPSHLLPLLVLFWVTRISLERSECGSTAAAEALLGGRKGAHRAFEAMIRENTVIRGL